jgi:phenylacetic acid degradation operon negative regulatory protein
MTLAPLLAHWRERPQRTWSVVVTVFGDAIVPHGGTVWLATLTELFAAMGVDAGAVRTAMSRLVADGWTERTRVGRNSAYRLTETGHTASTQAADRIYAAGPPEWDGQFQLVLQPRHRDALSEAGYGQAVPGLWISPGAPQPTGEAVTLTATTTPEAARILAARSWPLDRLAASFSRFIAAFSALPDWTDPAPLEAAVARTLLIHEYRRVVLHAPALPAEILPPDWPGTAARDLCAKAYTALLAPSERWLSSQDLPPAGPSMQRRFRERVTQFA